MCVADRGELHQVAVVGHNATLLQELTLFTSQEPVNNILLHQVFAHAFAQTRTHTHTHAANAHAYVYTHIHKDQPGLLSDDRMTAWAIHVHVPTMSSHLGTKKRGRRGREREKSAEDDGEGHLFGGKEGKRMKTMLLFSSVLYWWWIYCLNKKKKNVYEGSLSNSMLRNWKLCEMEIYNDPVLFFSFFFQCGRSWSSLWGCNPIKKTIFYVCTVPEGSARPLCSITQACNAYFYKWGLQWLNCWEKNTYEKRLCTFI